MTRLFTPEQERQIATEYAASQSSTTLAAKYGCCPDTILSAVRHCGGAVRSRREGLVIAGPDHRIFAPEEDRIISAKHRDGATVLALAKALGCSATAIRAAITRAGRTPRSYAETVRLGLRRGTKPQFTPDEAETIAAEHAAGLSLGALAKRWGRDRPTIRDTVHRTGGDIWLTSVRKWTVNHDYFEDISSPAISRWLGFVAADGCITAWWGQRLAQHPMILSFRLQGRDRAHLEAFCEAIGYNGPIRNMWLESPAGQLRPYSHLAICSVRLCAHLVRHGLTPRKSLTLQPWQGPPELMRHYYGGLADGDGWVTHKVSGQTMQSKVGLCGSKPAVQAWADWVFGQIGDRKGVMVNNSSACWRAEYTHRQTVYALCQLLYTGFQGGVPLARKAAAAQHAMADITRRTAAPAP